jgi:hypothetical protein
MRTCDTEHLDVQEAKAALGDTSEGGMIVYARGDIGADAVPVGSVELRQLRGLIWDAMREGMVVLTQRRISEGKFEYRARKRRSIFNGK